MGQRFISGDDAFHHGPMPSIGEALIIHIFGVRRLVHVNSMTIPCSSSSIAEITSASYASSTDGEVGAVGREYIIRVGPVWYILAKALI